jgi:hypothetical protein
VPGGWDQVRALVRAVPEDPVELFDPLRVVPVLWHLVPSYPTVSEAWLRLLENLNAARTTPPAARQT